MVKIPTKTRKSKIATPPKNVSTFKAAKKSEKPKTKGVSKPKVATLIANKRVDVELPCSSKQAAGVAIGIGGIGIGSNIGGGCKIDSKVSWAASCTPVNEATANKEQLMMQQQTNVAITPPYLTAPTTIATQMTPTPTAISTNNSTNAMERVAVIETDNEIQLKFRSGVRYSDVLRSKNVSSSGSVKPLITNVPMPPSTQLMPSLNPQANEVKDIDLTLFPELGQHRSCPSSNNNNNSSSHSGSASVRLLQRTPTAADEDSPQATLERLQPNFSGGHDNHHNDNNNGSSINHNGNNINNNNINNNNNMSHHNHHSNHIGADSSNASNAENHDATEHAASPCPQCALNSLWVQHALFNSAQPYHMEIPEFNFLRADQNYPRFLGQFEDENYLKTENLALLGLKLALGGNFHSMHSNNGR